MLRVASPNVSPRCARMGSCCLREVIRAKQLPLSSVPLGATDFLHVWRNLSADGHLAGTGARAALDGKRGICILCGSSRPPAHVRLSLPLPASRPRLPYARNRIVMGSMHTGLEDADRRPRAARRVLRRARPRRRRPDRHRRLRAQPAKGWLEPGAPMLDHRRQSRRAPADHRRGARARAAGSRCRSCTPAATATTRSPSRRRRSQSPINPLPPRALSERRHRAHDRRLRRDGARWRARPATTASRSWAPRAT